MRTQMRLVVSSVVLLLIVAGRGMCVSVLPGWPLGTGKGVWSSPTLADLDGDGKLEVVAGSDDDKVYAWHTDGTLVAGWPQSTQDWVRSSPAVGDIDGDGKPEVVIGSQDNHVYAWHADGTPVAGWPQTTGFWVDGVPALGDLDGDGKLDVVIGSRDGKVYAWRGDGTPVPGWPQHSANSGSDTGFDSSAALVDLDGDGKLEVVIGCEDHHVYAWHADGTPVTGWPQSTGGEVWSSPAVGDIDGDGRPEVVVGSDDGYVYAWHTDGTPVAGWPQYAYFNGSFGVESSPALGDLDGDGKLEVVACAVDGRVYVWQGDGTPVGGWPQSTGDQIWGSPALGDLDGDGNLEVVIGSGDGYVYAWHADGSPVAGWPQSTGGAIDGSPALADLDGDGHLEVVIGSEAWAGPTAYAWKCDTSTGDLMPWPTFHRDMRRTGLYTTPLPAAAFSGTPTVGTAPLQVQFSDLSMNQPATWNWAFGDGTTASDPNPSHSYEKVGTYTVTLAVSNNGGADSATKAHYILVTFLDVADDFWALDQILSCVDAGIVKGYSDGTYKPTDPVTRDQMAVYISRALAGGDAAVPTGPATATFSDVPTDYWAFKYVEYAVTQNVVQGYSDGTYKPADQVTRDQMSVFIARAIATPTAGADLVNYTPPATATFPDVPTNFWAYKYVEYIAQPAIGVTKGYPDGDYHPEYICTRDQMAVYVARAFKLPL